MGAILIVDDERNIRETLAMYIRILGHTVETAADGETAMEAIDRREFDRKTSPRHHPPLAWPGPLPPTRPARAA
jgi:CheY-like chemotaxis protein